MTVSKVRVSNNIGHFSYLKHVCVLNNMTFNVMQDHLITLFNRA